MPFCMQMGSQLHWSRGLRAGTLRRLLAFLWSWGHVAELRFGSLVAPWARDLSSNSGSSAGETFHLVSMFSHAATTQCCMLVTWLRSSSRWLCFLNAPSRTPRRRKVAIPTLVADTPSSSSEAFFNSSASCYCGRRHHYHRRQRCHLGVFITLCG